MILNTRSDFMYRDLCFVSDWVNYCFVFTEQKLLCTTNQERSIQYIGLGRTNNCVIIQVLFSFNLTFPRTKQRIKHMTETISVRKIQHTFIKSSLYVVQGWMLTKQMTVETFRTYSSHLMYIFVKMGSDFTGWGIWNSRKICTQ